MGRQGWRCLRVRSHAGNALYKDAIDVAPPPIFAWLKGLDNRVARRVKVFGSMLVRRAVTAADVAANQTDP